MDFFLIIFYIYIGLGILLALHIFITDKFSRDNLIESSFQGKGKLAGTLYFIAVVFLFIFVWPTVLSEDLG